MKAWIAAIGLFALGLAPSAWAQTNGLQRFDITYAIRARGIGVGEAGYSFVFQGAAYQASSWRHAIGLVHMLTGASQDFTYEARGIVGQDGRIHPSAYQHQGGRNRRLVRVAFGSEIVTTAQPSMGMGNPPATAAQKAGAVDQVSMFAQMLTVAGAPCSQTIKVLMDGRTLFTLTFAPDGNETVNIAGFRGQAFRCSVQFTPIAGFSDPMRPARLSFLLGPANGYFVPLRVEMPTDDVGVIQLSATTFRIVGSR